MGISAGARLMVTRRSGKLNSELVMAALTRSRLSFTAVSGKPTMETPGRPLARCTSTLTSGASNPLLVRL